MYFVLSLIIVTTKFIKVVNCKTTKGKSLGFDLRFGNNASVSTSFNGSCAIRRMRSGVMPRITGIVGSGTVRTDAMSNDGIIAVGAGALDLDRHRRMGRVLISGFNISRSAVRDRDVNSAVDGRVHSGTIGTLVITYVFVLFCV